MPPRGRENSLPARRRVKLFYFAVGVLSHRLRIMRRRSVQARYSAADSVSGLASVSDAVVSGVYSRYAIIFSQSVFSMR